MNEAAQQFYKAFTERTLQTRGIVESINDEKNRKDAIYWGKVIEECEQLGVNDLYDYLKVKGGFPE